MGNPTGFMKHTRKLAPDEAPAERVKHYHEFHLHVAEDFLK